MAANYKRLPINHHAFAKVTPDSAYWTGMLMADGCVTKSDGHLARTHLLLGLCDVDHVQKFKEFLKADHKITITPPKTRLIKSGKCKGKKIHTNGFATIRVGSDHIAADLASFGVVPRKSLTARVGGGLEFNRHFWRGVIDGDGCITEYGQQPQIRLTGTRKLCCQFSDFVTTMCKGHGSVRQRMPAVFDAIFTGDSARAVIKTLYLKAPTYLDRKMVAAQSIMARSIRGSANAS